MKLKKYGRQAILSSLCRMALVFVIAGGVYGIPLWSQKQESARVKIITGPWVRVLHFDDRQLFSVDPQFLYSKYPGLDKELGSIECSIVQLYSRHSLREGVALSYISPDDGAALVMNQCHYMAITNHMMVEGANSKEKASDEIQIREIVLRCFFSNDPGEGHDLRKKSFFYVTLDLEKASLTVGTPFNKETYDEAIAGARRNILEGSKSQDKHKSGGHLAF